jgi:DNA repair protein RadC
MHLDARNHISTVELVAIGTLNTAYVHPRDTFRRAITEGSSAIIVAYNHPTGDVEPSDNDIRTTMQLHEAGEIVDIPLLDHLIVSLTKFYSFKMNGKQVITRR